MKAIVKNVRIAALVVVAALVAACASVPSGTEPAKGPNAAMRSVALPRALEDRILALDAENRWMSAACTTRRRSPRDSS